MEYRTVTELSANAGRVLTYNHLLQRIWGAKSNSDLQPMRTITVNITRVFGTLLRFSRNRS